MADHAKLRARFERFFKQGHSRLGWNVLFSCYGLDPNRAYHTLDHVERCLSLLDELAVDSIERGKGTAVEFRNAELAVFFHDAVYVPGDPENEMSSAFLLYGMRRMIDESFVQLELACDAILATRHHPITNDVATNALCDVDLAVLGEDPSRYATYVGQIRREYDRFSDAEWRDGRRKFLEAMARREVLYRHPKMVESFDGPARKNMLAELASLAG